MNVRPYDDPLCPGTNKKNKKTIVLLAASWKTITLVIQICFKTDGRKQRAASLKFRVYYVEC